MTQSQEVPLLQMIAAGRAKREIRCAILMDVAERLYKMSLDEGDLEKAKLLQDSANDLYQDALEVRLKIIEQQEEDDEED